MFPAAAMTRPLSRASQSRIAEEAAVGADDWTLHDLRRTTATFLAKLDTAPHVIERVLNHVSGSFAGVAGVYDRHAYVEEMRQALWQRGEWLRAKNC